MHEAIKKKAFQPVKKNKVYRDRKIRRNKKRAGDFHRHFSFRTWVEYQKRMDAGK